MKITLVVAMAENRMIGRAGGLPWRLSGDLKFFKRVTMGHPVIMGRKTYQSIGRALPGRRNIVITRDGTFSAEGIDVVAGLDEALELCRTTDVEEAMIIGGGEIYAQVLPRADRIYLTEVHDMIDGDTRFPPIDPAEWREVARERQQPETEDGPAYSFVTLERQS